MPEAKWKSFSDEQLKKIVSESTSFVQVQTKLGYSGKSGSIAKRLKEVFDSKNIDYSHFKGHAWNKKIDYIDNQFGTNNQQDIKNKLFQQRGYKCEKCGISQWQGQKITLQLHHKNGIHTDNRKDNLILLCPNCHAQTDNYAGKQSKTDKISQELFVEALTYSNSICDACRKLEITPNQSNYRKARELIEKYNLNLK